MRALAIALLLSQSAHAERRLTVEDAVAEAIRSYPQLQAARARARATSDVAKSAAGRLLPSVRLNEEYQHYNSPFGLPFGGMVFSVRDQDTNTFTAAADQPLLGLGKLSEEFLAQRRAADAQKAAVGAVEDDLRAGIQIGFLRYFEAIALRDTALASARQLDDQVQVTGAKVNAGVLTTADLLRVRVAADNARQQAISAGVQAATTHAQILSAIHVSPDEQVEFVEPTALLAPRETAPAAFDEAIGRRPEVQAAQLSLESARHHRSAATWSLFPDIDAEGAYIRVDGQKFAPANSAFVGVRASWAVWEWGTSWFQRQAAAAQAEAAKADLDLRKRQVEVEVATRRAELGATESAVKLAQETIASAEEAFRVTQAQERAGTATTTDLLDAQAALTQARLNLARARYEEAISRITLDRASGIH